MKLQELIDEMVKNLVATSDDAYRFEIKGNKKAGTRVRKVMQEVKTKAQEVRITIATIRKDREEG
jgi:hypothetical protein